MVNGNGRVGQTVQSKATEMDGTLRKLRVPTPETPKASKPLQGAPLPVIPTVLTR